MLWWTLQNIVVTALLAGAVWLACRTGRIGPVGRHALWLVVMIKLLTPPLVFWPWAIAPAFEASPKTGLEYKTNNTPILSQAPPETDVVVEAFGNDDSSVEQPHRNIGSTNLSLPVAHHHAKAPIVAQPFYRSLPWRDWLLRLGQWIWISGAIVFAAVQLIRIVRMSKRLRRSSPAREEIANRVLELSRRVGVNPVDVRTIAGIGSPLVWCLGRPVLLWPAEFSAELPPDALAGLIVHELAHVKRRDHWVGWLELVAGCLWWWNPLYWYARHQLRENAELACDGWVVQLLPRGRRAYGEALLAVCEFLSRQTAPMPAVGVSTGGRRFLERRLTMILQERFPLRVSRLGLIFIGFLGLAAIPAWSQKETTVDPSKGYEEFRGTAVTRLAPPNPPSAGLPADADEVLQQFQKQQEEIRREAEDRVAKSRELAIQHLQTMQDQHAKAGELDEAIAIRNKIRELQGQLHGYGAPGTPRVWRPMPGGTGLSDPGNLVAYRDRVGQSFLFEVTGHAEGSVWGTGVYTDDSTLAAAAVHAGILKEGEHGVVRVTILPGLSSYEGLMRNGVSSNSYPEWSGSYIVERAGATPRRLNRPTIDLNNLQSLRGHVGEVFTIEVVGSTSGSVWGTDVYTDDSSVGAAAVHAGLLKNGEHGLLNIIPLPGQQSYEPSTRNGVSSQTWPSWDGSYRLTHADESRPRVYREFPSVRPAQPQPQPPATAF